MMKMKTTRSLLVSLFMTCLIFAPVLGLAKDWAPKGSLTMQVSFGAGGSTDTLTRLLAADIEKKTGWNIVVENKPGGGGVAMLSGLMHKKPDGQTLGVAVNMPIITNLALRGEKLPFKIDSFDYLATLVYGETAFVAKADAPYDDFKGFMEYAKKNGANIGFDGKPQQLVFSTIAKQSGANLKLVSHKSGAEQIKSILGGHIDAGVLNGEQKKYIESGDIKLIASMNKKPHSYAPEVGTLIDAGYDFYTEPYFYIATPKGLPEDVKASLVQAIDSSLQSAEVVEAIKNVMQVGPTNLGPDGTEKMLEEGLTFISYLVEASKQ